MVERIVRGRSDANIRFTELQQILFSLGFQERVRGSHHIFTKSGIDEILNIQSKDGMAKPYQVKQVRNVIVKYNLVDGGNA